MAAAIGARHARRSACTRAWRRCSTWCATPRWGRVEETIGEDPYLVGTIGTAYVQGLESAGIVATLKHFVGYSASRAGPQPRAGRRSGPRELADVLLPPFEMALREGGAALGDELLHRHRRRARPRPTRTCSPACCATPGASTARSSPTTSASRSCRRCTAWPRTWARRPAPRSTAGVDVELPDRQDVRRAAARGGRRRAPSPRRSSTARCAGCCGRRRSSACSTRTGRPVPAGAARTRTSTTRSRCAARSTSTRPENRALARRARRAVGRAAAQRRRPAAARPGRIAVDRPATPTTRPRCSAATPSPCTSASQHPDCRSASSCPTLLEALRGRVPRRRDRHGAGLRRRRRRDRRHRRRRSRRPRDADVVRRSPSATGPGCSAAAPAARAATPRPRAARRRSSSCSTRCSTTGTPVVVVLLAGRPYALGRAAGRGRRDRAGVLPRRGGHPGASPAC